MPSKAPVRVEAASLDGQPTFFAVLFPWSDVRQQRTEPRPGPVFPFAATLLNFLVWLGFALVARHNLKLGRGDTRGAWRVGVYVAIVLLVTERFGGVADPREPFLAAVLRPMAAGLSFALAYLAIEPWTRRLWPHMIITWSRLVAGRWRDPLVARDFLTAVACVTSSYALLRLVQLGAIHAGEAPFPPATDSAFGIALVQLLGGGSMATIVRPLLAGLSVSMAIFFCMFVAFAVLRRKWLAGVAYVVMGTLLFAPTVVGSAWFDMFHWLLEMAFLLFMTLRFGLLAAAIFSCLSQILSQSALTYRFDEWYGQSSLIATAIVVVIALYGLRVSLAGRPLLSGLERVRS